MFDHSILLHKLSHQFNFSKSAIRLMKSYLANRQQTVNICDATSLKLLLEYGVSQGSILGPLIFVLYINKFHLFIRHSILLQNADDTTLIFAQKDPKSLTCCLNEDPVSYTHLTLPTKA